ncbi:delta(14)-sterol reductase [Trichodelitschia bisporula]|uniref:Delta(14)-sterol reductase n=1 Tax=Trichodelitschia bisporula TaxID=703511 RepID=A0A6G1HWJ9_9PEZI|nr:delta(14)-sterol reductase [Trichodelitschia bisporula]
MSAPSKPVAFPRKHGYEFFGPPGAFAISFGLPILCYAMTLLCNDVSGCPAPSLLSPSTLTLDELKREAGWKGWETIFNWKAFIANLGWYALSLVLNRVLPATEVQGTELATGGRLNYRFNAFNSAIFTMSILAAGTALQGADFPVWPFIWDNFVPLLTSNIVLAAVLATYVYVRSFEVKPGNTEKRELAAGGHTGNMLYDWFIGRELNPRVTLPLLGEIDIKAWMEMRPGLLGWIVLDCAMIARQYHHFGYVTDSILITTAAQAFYVFDGLYMEPAILTTMDITSDGFGFMLSFGDVAWLPFIYSIQTRYLAVHPVMLGPWMMLTFGVISLGYYIFRSANNEKNRFRTNPNDPKLAHLQFMETKAGSKLLTSGWWGTARHINYLGDWILSWSFCLPTGVAGYTVVRNMSFIPPGAHAMLSEPGTVVVPGGEAYGWGMVFTYFFIVYFATLLVHRELRDEEKCQNKYGTDWDRYCKKVPWRIVPWVY